MRHLLVSLLILVPVFTHSARAADEILPAQEPRQLNNLVVEVLSLTKPAGNSAWIKNSAERFLFVSIVTSEGQSAPELSVDSKKVVLQMKEPNRYEGMIRCSAGTLKVEWKASPEELIIRGVPDLAHSMYGKAANPYVVELGDYNWKFLREHILDNFNIVIGHESHTGEEEMLEWTSEGKWWFSQVHLFWNPPSALAQYEMWQATPGTTHPLMQGMFIDEFLSTDNPEQDKLTFQLYRTAMRRILDNPTFEGRKTYNFVVHEVTPAMEGFVRLLADRKQGFAYEWYIPTIPEDHNLPERLGERQSARRAQWEKAAPGSASTLQMVCLSLMAQPPATFDDYPHVDFYTHLDRQMHYVATDPVFSGASGLMGYYTPYCSEDQLRLFSKLVRHYAIEGKTSRVLDTPYILPHVQNPDFAEGLDDWKVEPAEVDPTPSVSAVNAKGFGKLQGRFLTAPGHDPNVAASAHGDGALLTKRSKIGPNRVSQILQKLRPGGLYVIRFFTGNHQDLLNKKSNKYAHAVNVQIDGVEMLPELHFQALGARYMPVKHDGFDSNHPYYWNYHQYVFRAKEETAELILSDWKNSGEPGGEPGEELLWNHMKLHPYLEP